jgi:hypothetical protein
MMASAFREDVCIVRLDDVDDVPSSKPLPPAGSSAYADMSARLDFCSTSTSDDLAYLYTSYNTLLA